MASETTSESGQKKRRVPLTLVLVVGITIVEAVGFFAFAKLFGGGPEASYGQPGGEHYVQDAPATQPGTAEVVLLRKFKAPNTKTGRLYIYDLDIVVKVPTDQKGRAEKLVAERQGEISDAVARIIRGADPRMLDEDELKTLRLQIQHALVPVFQSPDLIEQVLIPRCVPILSG